MSKRLRRMPVVTTSMRVRQLQRLSSLVVKPTVCPALSPKEAAILRAAVLAAILLGSRTCVW
jgi:ribosome biogenesis protein Tsr3